MQEKGETVDVLYAPEIHGPPDRQTHSQWATGYEQFAEISDTTTLSHEEIESSEDYIHRSFSPKPGVPCTGIEKTLGLIIKAHCLFYARKRSQAIRTYSLATKARGVYPSSDSDSRIPYLPAIFHFVSFEALCGFGLALLYHSILLFDACSDTMKVGESLPRGFVHVYQHCHTLYL